MSLSQEAPGSSPLGTEGTEKPHSCLLLPSPGFSPHPRVKAHPCERSPSSHWQLATTGKLQVRVGGMVGTDDAAREDTRLQPLAATSLHTPPTQEMPSLTPSLFRLPCQHP